MVVQHHVFAAVTQQADQVPKILALELVAHHHLTNFHGLHGDAEDVGHSGMFRAAIGNDRRQQQAADQLIAVGIRLTERQ